jgi:hypothetical protein
MQEIQIVDALSGAGKTYAALEDALSKANCYRKILFVQPSIKLIEQSLADCPAIFARNIYPKNPRHLRIKILGQLRTKIPRHLKVRAIHSLNSPPNTVKKRLIEHLNNSGDNGEILFITHESFLQLPYFDRRQDWDVIIDEIPSVNKDLTLNIPKTHALLTDNISVIGEHPLWYRIAPENQNELTKIHENRERDDAIAVFKDLAKHVCSDKWEVFCKKENWHQLIDGAMVKFGCFALLRPDIFDGFKSVTIMGAMLEDTLLYHVWRNQGVMFEPNFRIQLRANSRLAAHENGNLLTIKYFTSQDWSKSYRNKPGIVDGNEVSKMDFMREKILEDLNGENFLWVANNDVENEIFDRPGHNGQPNAIRLPNSPHGLNEYQDVDNVVFLSALNPSPAHFRFLEDQGISPDHLRDAWVHQITYQTVMRCSLRDASSTAPKTVYVTDLKSAEWLSDKFPGSTIEKIEGFEERAKKVGRPLNGSKPMSSRDRKTRSRHAKRLKSLEKIRSDHCHKNTINPISNFVTSWGTEFNSVYDWNGERLPDQNADQFIEHLKRCHRNKFDSKESNFHICPSIFDPNKSEHSDRGIENVVHATGIWLDNDGGDLDYKEFKKQFPDIRMVCCNTWSGNDRYRVFIPTSCSMTHKEYELITKFIILQLERSGYFGDAEFERRRHAGHAAKRHGFDPTHLHAASLFYLPCKAENVMESFFEDYPGTLLDPSEWLNAAKTSVPEKTISNVVQFPFPEADREDVQQAISRYKSLPPGQGKRHHGFFTLGTELKKLGLDWASIEMYLTKADYDGSRKRKKTIQDVLRSLRKQQSKYGEAA